MTALSRPVRRPRSKAVRAGVNPSGTEQRRGGQSAHDGPAVRPQPGSLSAHGCGHRGARRQEHVAVQTSMLLQGASCHGACAEGLGAQERVMRGESLRPPTAQWVRGRASLTLWMGRPLWAKRGQSPLPSGQLLHANPRKVCDKWPLGEPGQAAALASEVTCATKDAISATARRASGLTSKLSWNMCIALSHT